MTLWAVNPPEGLETPAVAQDWLAVAQDFSPVGCYLRRREYAIKNMYFGTVASSRRALVGESLMST